MVDINNGIVMKGPTPTMLAMFRAVACKSPKPRVSWGWALDAGVSGNVHYLRSHFTARGRFMPTLRATGWRHGESRLAAVAPQPERQRAIRSG